MKREFPLDPTLDVAGEIASWAAQHRRIRRAWMVGGIANRKPGPGEAVDIALEVDPIADSEETLVVWLANEGAWQAQLRARLGRAVGLEWVDTDGTHTAQAVRDEAKQLVYDRSGA